MSFRPPLVLLFAAVIIVVESAFTLTPLTTITTGGTRVWLQSTTLSGATLALQTSGGLSLFSLTDASLQTPDLVFSTTTGTTYGALDWPLYVFPFSTLEPGVRDLELSETLSGDALTVGGVAAALDGTSQTGVVGLDGGGATLVHLTNETTLVLTAMPGAPAPVPTALGAAVAAAHGDAFVSSAQDRNVYVSAYSSSTAAWSARQTITDACPGSSHSGALATSSATRVLVVGCSGGATVYVSTASTPTWVVAQQISGLAAGFGQNVAISDDGKTLVLGSTTALAVFSHDNNAFVSVANVDMTQQIKAVAVNAATSSHNGTLVAALLASETRMFVLRGSHDGPSESESSSYSEGKPENKWNTLWIPLICGLGGGLILVAVVITVVVCCCKHPKKGGSNNDMLFTDIAMEDHHMS